MTAFNKYVFPVIWFGPVGVVALIGLLGSFSRPETFFPMLIVPLIMMGLGYLIMKNLIWDLVDEVWDNGNELLLVNGGHMEHVLLADIVNISYAGFSNPKRATLLLRNPGRWGKKVSFMPQRGARRFFDFSDNEIIDDLIQRVDEARRKV